MVCSLIGIRDRALIGVMVYSFARVGAAVAMGVGDFFQHRKRLWLRLHEEGGKRHEVPRHPSLESYLDAYVRAAGIASDIKGRLFRSMHKGDRITDKAMTRFDVFHMIKRRAKVAALPYSTCCHTFRASCITTYLQNGGTLEHAQTIANHESPRTTKLYDRTREELSLDLLSGVRAPLDVRKRADLQPAVDEVEEALGPIDILVNNAGMAIVKRALDADEEQKTQRRTGVSNLLCCFLDGIESRMR
jgi:integrase